DVEMASMAQAPASHLSRNIRARWPTRYSISASESTPETWRAVYSPRECPITIDGGMQHDLQNAARLTSTVTTTSCVCIVSLVDISRSLLVIISRKWGNLCSLQILTHKSTVSQKESHVAYNSRPMPA